MDETIVISALVAAVVTLLIEYAAKPGLDARKVRILEQRRESATWFAWSDASSICAAVSRPRDMMTTLRRRYSTNGGRGGAAEYVVAVKQLVDGLADKHLLLPEPIEGLALRTSAQSESSAMMNRLGLSRDDLNAADAEIDRTMSILDDYFSTPWYRILQQASLRKRAEALTDTPIGPFLKDPGAPL